MNLIEALEAALPEIQIKTAQRSYPKLDPGVIAKAHVEQGIEIVLAKLPGSDTFVRFTPEQWQVIELFDGERSYAEVSELAQQFTNVAFTEDDVKEFAAFLRDETDLLHATPIEKNITLKQKLGAHRHKRKRFAFKDISDITLHRWPDVDNYLTRLKPHVEFVYTTWFTLLTLCCFGVMVAIWTGKWDDIWGDSFRFYNFTDKSAWDLLEFWVLFGAMAFCHETAHGMTCKHFGGNVEKMEFLLMYFAPTFVCDVTQIWIVGDRKARLCTIIAGIWADLVICFFATVVWWTTPTGMWIHDFAYKIIMVSGIGVTLLNLNPLIKIDGYYMFSELIGEVDLKERSTIYVSDWAKRHIFGLPVEVEYVPRRRRLLYIAYAILSGIYSYLLLAVVVFFIYHVSFSYNPEFAWLPALLAGQLVFKSRVRRLVRFMKDMYLDKNDRFKAWLTPARASMLAVVALAVLFAPLWPDFVQARFVLEPEYRAVIRAEVPGTVVRVFASENEPVSAGSPLVQLENLSLQSEAAETEAAFRVASARAVSAELHYTDLGRAERELQASAARDQMLSERLAHLKLSSPIRGVVVTPRLEDLQGKYLEAGSAVAEVADLSTMVARTYIPEFGMRDVHVGASVKLQVRSQIVPIAGILNSVDPVSSETDPDLSEKDQLSGIVPPPFYVGSVYLPNDGTLRDGMAGTAKIYVCRRSVAEVLARFTRDLVERRFW